MDYGWILLGVVVLIAVVGLGMSGVERKVTRTERQLARLERKIDAVVAHLGISIPEPALPSVRQLLMEGKKIAAIKAYRESTGAGLAEAKDTVERMAL